MNVVANRSGRMVNEVQAADGAGFGIAEGAAFADDEILETGGGFIIDFDGTDDGGCAGRGTAGG